MIFIGIDPGGSGGIAAIDSQGTFVESANMPSTERDALDILDLIGKGTGGSHRRRAALEHVWSIPGQAGAFRFGVNVGMLRTALTAARIPFDQVLPKAWQAALGVRYPVGATDTAKKNITKQRAQQLFPSVPMTHAISDAMLLAEYARRQEMGSRRVKR